ncbi:hypothetical protein SPRG_14648 [Saprolegnia parasitica CBS 223.65]|uniref:Olfactomedin-like domain-containing protein n=1 Tax=Saprolegnia parasitica (strain CBS 223.65) TaxID=695850 RepID=A0A067BRN6_SAPPC|nr:hypothetical protein SPRG_14648 [Saprolegnia parasitica CBS 223.65]KDO19465.1 hypothetical protein SPRG_14648 [Saprolegnia parasitica CBS 223.65]|eukprot:XP_012209809.1 hypothetical protein SPRG_14648 [Saprolegnia parasitica CBS 223.65]
MKAVLLRLAVCATFVLAASATEHAGCGADVPTTAPVPTVTTAVPAPTTEAPAPTTETPAPTTETPAPTTEAPAPTTEAPAPTTAAPAPTTEAPAPTTASPAPTTEAPASTTQAPAPTPEAPATWKPLGLGKSFSGVSGDSQGLCFINRTHVVAWVPGTPIDTKTIVGRRQATDVCAIGVLYSRTYEQNNITMTNLATKVATTLVTGLLKDLSPTDGQTLCVRDPDFRCATNDGNGFGSFQVWTYGRPNAVRAFVKDRALVYGYDNGYSIYYATVDATTKAITNYTKVANGLYAAADGPTACVVSAANVISCVTSVSDMLAGKWKTYDGTWSFFFEVVGNTVYAVDKNDGTLHYLQLA